MVVTQLTGTQARMIPLSEQAVDICLHVYHADTHAYLMTGDRGLMEPRLAQMRLKEYVTCCGLEGVTFQTLRDTFTRNCVEAGLSPGALCAILGYSSVTSIPRDLLISPMECITTDVELLESAGF